MAEQTWQGPKATCSSPLGLPTYSVLQSMVLSATSCSQLLAPEPPVNAGSLLSAYRSALPRPGQVLRSAATGVPALPAPTHMCLILAQQPDEPFTSHLAIPQLQIFQDLPVTEGGC